MKQERLNLTFPLQYNYKISIVIIVEYNLNSGVKKESKVY
jgi:hypothetical protein